MFNFLQIFPEQCGYNVAEWWCPSTNVSTLIIALFTAVILAVIASYIINLSKKIRKTKIKDGMKHDNN